MSEGSLLRPGRECTGGLAFSLRALTLPRPLPSLPQMQLQWLQHLDTLLRHS